MKQVTACLFVIGSIVVAGCNRSSEPYVLGHVAPRTGPDQAAGLRAADGAGLAAESINVDSTKHVNKRPIAIVHGDSGAASDGAAHQAARLISVNQALALVAGRNCAEFDQLVPVAAAQQIVVIAPCGGGSTAGGKYILPIGLAPSERGRASAKYAAEERKVKNVAVVVNLSGSIHALCAAGFEAEFKHADRTIHSGFEIRSEKDAERVAKRLIEIKPAAVLYCGPGRDFLDFRAQLQANKSWFDSALLMYGGEDEGAVSHGDRERTNGAFFTVAFHPDDSAPRVQEFVARFRNRNGREPDSEAALAYDAVNFLVQYAKKAESFESKKLLPELEKFEETSCLTGPLWLTKERSPRRTIYVGEMKEGKVELRKSYLPEKK